MELLAFIAGIACALPQTLQTSLTFILTLFIMAYYLPLSRYFLLGLVITLIHYSIDTQKLTSFDNQTVLMKGYVDSIPLKKNHGLQFVFFTKSINHQAIKTRVFTRWYFTKQQLSAGDLLIIKAKIKLPRNFANPGNFDYKTWLLSKRIHSTAFVVKNEVEFINQSPIKSYYLLAFRQYLASKLDGISSNHQTIAIVQALTIGVKNSLSNTTKDLLRQTGTSHLLAISGLHVGLIAGLFYFLVTACWRLSSYACLKCPAQKAGAVVAIISAVVYAALAGFSVPTQRALIMISCFMVKFLIQQNITVWQSLRWSLFFVLLLNPYSLLMPGFYLSFCAVLVLVMANQLITVSGWRKVLLMQITCVMGLVPLSLFYFNYASFVAVFANLVAIPLVGFILLPMALMLVLIVSTPIANGVFTIFSFFLTQLLNYLTWLSQFNTLSVTLNSLSLNHLLLLCCALACMVLIPYWRIKILAIFLMLPVLTTMDKKLSEGEAIIEVLDVGQGLAVLVKTRDHQLLYDSGKRFLSGSDMAKLVIIPRLHLSGVNKLDRLIISHTDLDHRGGLKRLINDISLDQLITNDPSYYKANYQLNSQQCHGLTSWQWNGIEFRFLAIKKNLLNDNDNSCVLKISNRFHSMLLTGDIEHKGEQYLLNHYAQRLKSELLLVPHHGSRTSSSIDFIKAIKPKFAIISAGFNNRYHFPHKKIISNYQTQGVNVFNTAFCGMTSWKMTNNVLLTQPTCYRTLR